jgi:putative DNA primase/helicase
MSQNPPTTPPQSAEIIDMVAKRADGKLVRKGSKRALIAWPKTYKDGQPLCHIENTRELLRHYGVSVRFNAMTHEAEHTFEAQEGWASDMVRSAAEAQVREWAAERDIYKARRFEDQMTILIAEKAYHPAEQWIRSAPWDGVDRFPELIESIGIQPRYMAGHGDLAMRLVEAWLVTAAKAAIMPTGMSEGVAAQGVLVLQGGQGRFKTRWLMSLVPKGSDWAKEGVILNPHDRDSKVQATSAWIVELGELDGTFKKSDQAAIKGFLTSRKDTYRRPYAKTHDDIARRTVFVASVNESRFLLDDTGSRRWWVLPIDRCNPEHEVNLQQLWAQAAAIAQAEPHKGWLTTDELAELDQANRLFEVVDPLLDDLHRMFDLPTGSESSWMTYDQIRQVLRPHQTWTRPETISLGRSLLKFGAVERVAHGNVKVFGLLRKIQPERYVPEDP